MADRKIIMLTPVKNEEYILPSFIEASLKLVDVLIIADQNSDDRSVEIAAAYENVIVLENDAAQFDEAVGRSRLFEAARREYGSNNVLLAIDADEFFFPGASVEAIRDELFALPPGTTLLFDKPTLVDGSKRWKRYGSRFPIGYSDDGMAFTGSYIHSRRVPEGRSVPVEINSCAFVHLDLLDKSAYQSKRAFYNCIETVRGESTRVLRWRRGYYRYRSQWETGLSDVDASASTWFEGIGISLTSLKRSQPYWWDLEVLKMFAKHGARKFWWDSVWHRPWEEILVLGKSCGLSELPDEIERPPVFISFLRELMVCALREYIRLKPQK